MSKGVTLIEVVIYIALFSLLMGTAFLSAYDILESSGKLAVKNNTSEEANFVLRKIDWAMTGVSSFTNTPNTLHVNKYDGNQIDIKLVGTKIKLTENSGTTATSDFITTGNISVSSLQFTAIAGTPKGITAAAIIDGINFSITKYMRK
ncbi:MAG TPA: prepilin-type N-terminal cleavage/methylation domain-containing protein [Candidatus Paceibacterota bacterium]|jgi:Tfp pilus assembly protein PilE|nr:prepilin-type N-terminal cleavage/methylation domain-containing protein [Candidatus Paceibacterota bacterium]